MHGVGVGGVVVDHHARRHVDRPQRSRSRFARHLADFRRQPQPARTAPARSAPTAAPGGAARRRRRRPRPAPRRCRAPCRWSCVWMRASTMRGAGHRQRAGDPAEQARMVGCSRPSPRSPRAPAAAGCRTVSGACGASASRIMRGVARMGLGIEGQPVAGIAEAEEVRRSPPPASPASSAAAASARAPRARRVRARTARRPAPRPRASRARAAASPSSRSTPSARHGAHVGHRQHQQQPQPLGRLHGLGEVEDGLGVVDVALEGGLADQQVVQHQPGDGLGLLGATGRARADLLRDARRRARNGRRRGPWRCRAAASRHRARGATAAGRSARRRPARSRPARRVPACSSTPIASIVCSSTVKTW